VTETISPLTTDQSDFARDGADVRADHVEITQGGANSVHARTVSIQQGGAGQVRAGQLTVTQGGVAVARTERIEIGEGGGAFAVIADQATINPGGNVVLLIGRSVSGDVRPVLDGRAATIIGGGLVLAALLLRSRR
jgi:hypothetical protein